MQHFNTMHKSRDKNCFDCAWVPSFWIFLAGLWPEYVKTLSQPTIASQMGPQGNHGGNFKQRQGISKAYLFNSNAYFGSSSAWLWVYFILFYFSSDIQDWINNTSQFKAHYYHRSKWDSLVLIFIYSILYPSSK